MFAALGLPVLLVAGPFDEALRLVPDSANVLVLVDVKAVHASPVGQREDWAEKTKQRYRSAGGVMAPGSERVLIAGQCAPGRRPVGLAGRRGGRAGRPGRARVDPARARRTRRRGRSVVRPLPPRGVLRPPGPQPVRGLPPGRPPGPRPVAAALPDRRQQPTPAVSPYSAPRPPARPPGTPSSSPWTWPTRWTRTRTGGASPGSSRWRTSRSTTPASRCSLAGVRGLTFTADFGENIEATLRVDFSPGIGEYRSVLKAVLLEVLESAGAAIPELADWKATYPDSSMVLTGPLSPASLVRVVGLFAFPQAGGAAPANAPTGPTKEATKRYFETVNEIVEDVRSLKQDRRYDKTALWHETAAKKIEQLNPRGVDPDALAYGGDVAQRLRAIAGSLRGVPIDLDKLKGEGTSTVTRTSPVGGGGAGGRSPRTRPTSRPTFQRCGRRWTTWWPPTRRPGNSCGGRSPSGGPRPGPPCPRSTQGFKAKGAEPARQPPARDRSGSARPAATDPPRVSSVVGSHHAGSVEHPGKGDWGH